MSNIYPDDLYLDGKKHCDVVKWALAANLTLADAKIKLIKQYPEMTVTFQIQKDNSR